MTKYSKGDAVTVTVTRPELLPEDFTGKTGKVLAVQRGTGYVLVKFKGRAWPVSFEASSVRL